MCSTSTSAARDVTSSTVAAGTITGCNHAAAAASTSSSARATSGPAANPAERGGTASPRCRTHRDADAGRVKVLSRSAGSMAQGMPPSRPGTVIANRRAVEVTGARRFAITVPGLLGGIPWAMLPALRERTFTLPASASRWVRQRGDAVPPRSAGFAAGPDVARADEEVDAAAAAWLHPVIVPAATVDDVTSLAADVDVLHIAAHGRHSSDNPMFSGL